MLHFVHRTLTNKFIKPLDGVFVVWYTLDTVKRGELIGMEEILEILANETSEQVYREVERIAIEAGKN